MFDKTENRSASAKAVYKQNADRKLIYAAVFHKGDKVFLKTPTFGSQKEKVEREEHRTIETSI